VKFIGYARDVEQYLSNVKIYMVCDLSCVLLLEKKIIFDSVFLSPPIDSVETQVLYINIITQSESDAQVIAAIAGCTALQITFIILYSTCAVCCLFYPVRHVFRFKSGLGKGKNIPVWLKKIIHTPARDQNFINGKLNGSKFKLLNDPKGPNTFKIAAPRPKFTSTGNFSSLQSILSPETTKKNLTSASSGRGTIYRNQSIYTSAKQVQRVPAPKPKTLRSSTRSSAIIEINP
jgi:hypothetical protein